MSTENTKPIKKESKIILVTRKVYDFISSLIFINRYPLAILIILVMLVLLGFIFFIVGANSSVILQITNFAFAILLGLASVCFSWVRTFDSPENKIAISIRQSGELSLLAAILFLIASALNYLLSSFISTNNSSLISTMIFTIIKWTVLLIFFIAANIFLKVLARLLLVLRKRYKSIEHTLNDEDIY
jgi:hypothetical protein